MAQGHRHLEAWRKTNIVMFELWFVPLDATSELVQLKLNIETSVA